VFQPDDRRQGISFRADDLGSRSGPTHVATVPAHLDIQLQGRLLDAMESVLVDAGAQRIWIDPNHTAMAVMADLPVRSV
jgi:hypothetical protein